MGPELITIIVLVVLFIIATTLPVNLGVLALVAAFLVGTLTLGLDVDAVILGVPDGEEINGGFPGDLFVLLVGLTYLFALAQNNGTIDLVVQWSMRLVRGRLAAAPWVFFALSALLSAIGALFAVAIVAPLAMPFARRYGVNLLLMGMMVVHGSLGGAFSPISVYGSFVNETIAASGLPGSPTTLFLAPLVLNLVIAVVIYVLLGGRALIGQRVSTAGDDREAAPAREAPGAARSPGAEPSGSSARGGDRPGDGDGDGDGDVDRAEEGDVIRANGAPEGRDEPPARVRVGFEQVTTLVGLLVLALGSVAFELDIGFLALAIAAALRLAFPRRDDALRQVSWSTVVLICGVITYVGVLRAAGTIEYVSGGITAIGAPLIAALLLCYLGGVLSAFASSVGILGVAIPLAVPFLQQGAVSAVGLIAALAVASTIVDVSPFSSNGALVLANAPDDVDRNRFYRQMLAYSGVVVAAGPLLAWLLLVVPGWL